MSNFKRPNNPRPSSGGNFRFSGNNSGSKPSGNSFGGNRFSRFSGGGNRPGGNRFGGNNRGGGGNRGALGMPSRQTQFDIRRIIQESANKTAPVTTDSEKSTNEIKNSFKDFAINEQIKNNIVAKGYNTPTPIQDQAIPLILDGSDVVGIANTGTGKSAAFLIPLLHKAVQNQQERVLVIVPTRELATQLNDELKEFAKGMRIFAVTCVGGMSLFNQVGNLRRPHNFVIGTPGRLKDLVNRGNLQLNYYSTIVLDEVDRMLDMGFINDIKALIAKLPAKRQSLFFSATLKGEVEKVMQQFVKDYVKISVKTGETALNVTQELIEIVSPGDKLVKLKEILSNPHMNKAIVFVRTKRGADRLYLTLKHQGFSVDAIHGDKRQNLRQRVITEFKSGRLKALIATDVAARGLDISNVSHVINYDLPATSEDYIHRIGRTARGDKSGVALTFMEK